MSKKHRKVEGGGSTTTCVERCTCVSETQDRMLGKGLRLHNRSQSSKTPLRRRCTVCGTRKDT